MAQIGNLTVQDLNANKSRLELSQHEALRNKITQRADAALSKATLIIKRRFNYDAQQAANNDDELVSASKAAFEAADGALQEEFFDRRISGNPMTSTEMIKFARERITEYEDIYVEQLRENFQREMETALGIIAELSFDSEFQADPMGSLDRWYESLTTTEQAQSINIYIRTKSKVRKYSNKGLF